MKCKFSGPNVKILARAVIYLSKISAEVHIEADGDGLCLSTVNTSKTAFATVKFSTDFFLDFDDSQDSDDDCRVCKIAAKSILPMFKSLLTNPPEMGIISLAPGASTIVFEFKCRQKLSKTYTVSVLDYTRDMTPVIGDNFKNNITGSHKVFSNITGSFHKSTHELALNITQSSINIRNYIDDPEDRMCIRSCYELNTTEFETFAIKNEGNLGFSYSDFKAFVTLADQCEVNIRMVFDGAGEPMHLSFRSDSGLYRASLFVATIIEDDDESAAASLPSQSSVIPMVATAASSAPSTNNDFNFHGRRNVRRIASVEEISQPNTSQNNDLSVIEEEPPNSSLIHSLQSQISENFAVVSLDKPPPPPQNSESLFESSEDYDTIITNRHRAVDCNSAPIGKSEFLNLPNSVFRIPAQTPSATRNQLLAGENSINATPSGSQRESIPETPTPRDIRQQMSEDVLFQTEPSGVHKNISRNLNVRDSVGLFNDGISSCPDSTVLVNKRKEIFRRCFDNSESVPIDAHNPETLVPDSDEEKSP